MDGSAAMVLYAGMEAQPVNDQAFGGSGAADVAAGAAGVGAEEGLWGKDTAAGAEDGAPRCVQKLLQLAIEGVGVAEAGSGMMVMVMASDAVMVAFHEMLEVGVVVVLLLEKCQTHPPDDVDVDVEAGEVEGSHADQYWLGEDVEVGEAEVELKLGSHAVQLSIEDVDTLELEEIGPTRVLVGSQADQPPLLMELEVEGLFPVGWMFVDVYVKVLPYRSVVVTTGGE